MFPNRVLLPTASAAAVASMVAMSSLTSIAAAQNVEGTVRIVTAESQPISAGPFTVQVTLEDLNHYGELAYDDNRDTVPDRTEASDGLGAFEFTIHFDPDVLEAIDAEPGPDLGRTGRRFQCLRPARELGSYRLGCISTGPTPPGPQGTLTLATVTFRPLAVGNSPLFLEAVLAGPLGSDQVPLAVEGSQVRVVGAATSSVTSQPAEGGTLTAIGTAGPSSTDDADERVALGTAPTTGGSAVGDVEPGGSPNPEAQSAKSSGDGDARLDGAGLWLAIALGVAGVAAVAALGGVLWWRQTRGPGA